MYDRAGNTYHKDWNATSVYAWNLDGCSEQEIKTLVNSMMVCYRTYVSYDKNLVNAYRKLMVGFEGTLQNWLYAKQKEYPNMINLWESMFLINENGAAILDSQGNTHYNMIGCMLHYIVDFFLGILLLTNIFKPCFCLK